MNSNIADITLTPEDIPGASLSQPYEVHTVSALRWWLLVEKSKLLHLGKSRCLLTSKIIYDLSVLKMKIMLTI